MHLRVAVTHLFSISIILIPPCASLIFSLYVCLCLLVRQLPPPRANVYGNRIHSLDHTLILSPPLRLAFSCCIRSHLGISCTHKHYSGCKSPARMAAGCSFLVPRSSLVRREQFYSQPAPLSSLFSPMTPKSALPHSSLGPFSLPLSLLSPLFLLLGPPSPPFSPPRSSPCLCLLDCDYECVSVCLWLTGEPKAHLFSFCSNFPNLPSQSFYFLHWLSSCYPACLPACHPVFPFLLQLRLRLTLLLLLLEISSTAPTTAATTATVTTDGEKQVNHSSHSHV